MMKQPTARRILLPISFLLLVLAGCHDPLKEAGDRYREKQDSQSLNEFLSLLPVDIDTTLVRRYLGEPIDMGFDYRYLTGETGPDGCVMGAVFHIADDGSIDEYWYGQICE